MGHKFSCSHCEQTITVLYVRIGEPAICKACGQHTIVPENAEKYNTTSELKQSIPDDLFEMMKPADGKAKTYSTGLRLQQLNPPPGYKERMRIVNEKSKEDFKTKYYGADDEQRERMRVAVMNSHKIGADTLFLIAKLSIISSIFMFFDITWLSLFNLGLPRLPTDLNLIFANQEGMKTEILPFILNLILALFLMYLGEKVSRENKTAFTLSTIIYFLDTICVLILHNWLALIIHLLLLFRLNFGYYNFKFKAIINDDVDDKKINWRPISVKIASN